MAKEDSTRNYIGPAGYKAEGEYIFGITLGDNRKSASLAERLQAKAQDADTLEGLDYLVVSIKVPRDTERYKAAKGDDNLEYDLFDRFGFPITFHVITSKDKLTVVFPFSGELIPIASSTDSPVQRIPTSTIEAIAERNRSRGIELPPELQQPLEAKLPNLLPQQTFEEVHVLGRAMTDAPAGRNWKRAEDNEGLIYKRPGDRLEVRFDPSTLPEIWSRSRPKTLEAIEAVLKERGFNGLLTLQLAINCAIAETDTAIAIDEFVKRIFDVRTGKGSKEWNAKRVWVWETLCTIFNMKLSGKRAGTYKDPKTKKTISLVFEGEPLIAPSPGSKTFAEQPSLWPDDIPVTIGFTMGAWGVEAKKNPKVFQYFGDLKAILDIPGGKPSGAWARCILTVLNQKWREGAKDVKITPHTRENTDGIERKGEATQWPKAFTRRMLLVDTITPDPQFSMIEIIETRPKRAVTYWKDAIKLLKEAGHISYCKELTKLDSKRQGWQNDWLDQPLDIRPNEEGKKAAGEIKDAHKKVLTERKRSTKTRG